MLVKDIYAIIDSLAPFDTADSYDNVGLLLGDENAPVKGIMLALDATEKVLDEMQAKGLNLLITHHPLMFSPIKRLLESDYESHLMMEMVRRGIHFIAAHTNFDIAVNGVDDTLAKLFHLKNITGEGYIRIGEMPLATAAFKLQADAAQVLNTNVVMMGDANKTIRKLCVCSGGGSEEWHHALCGGADAFLTGEIKHHHALEATAKGLVLYMAGHFATENPGMDTLLTSLQSALDNVQCNVAICRAECESYPVR